MNPDVINCIPSKCIRAYLKNHHHTLSILQQATIIYAYAPDTDKTHMFRRLIAQSDSESERLLLSAELIDPDAACEIYRWRGPYLAEGLCDFSDECYLCYSLSETLSMNCTHYSDLVHVHYHINVCEADSADYIKLHSQHKRAANTIRKILAHKKTGRHFRQPA